MHSLVVVAHPDPTSLTHHVATRISEALPGYGHTVEVADLSDEQFDPRFTLTDRRLYTTDGPAPADVVAEQRRVDRADHLILVFPVYWWSMPALLKGWVDRVFVQGWAFDGTTTPTKKMMGDLTVHLVMLGAEGADGFRKRGYDRAIDTQIGTGIIDYCGARPGAREFLFDSESRTLADVERDLSAVIDAVTAAVSEASQHCA